MRSYKSADMTAYRSEGVGQRRPFPFWVDNRLVAQADIDPVRREVARRGRSGVDDAGGLVAGAGEGVAVEDLDGGDDAEAFLDGGLAAVADGAGVLGRGRPLDAHPQGGVVVGRLDHHVLEG